MRVVRGKAISMRFSIQVPLCLSDSTQGLVSRAALAINCKFGRNICDRLVSDKSTLSNRRAALAKG